MFDIPSLEMGWFEEQTRLANSLGTSEHVTSWHRWKSDTNIENEISRGNVCTQEIVFCQNVMGWHFHRATLSSTKETDLFKDKTDSRLVSY